MSPVILHLSPASSNIELDMLSLGSEWHIGNWCIRLWVHSDWIDTLPCTYFTLVAGIRSSRRHLGLSGSQYLKSHSWIQKISLTLLEISCLWFHTPAAQVAFSWSMLIISKSFWKIFFLHQQLTLFQKGPVLKRLVIISQSRLRFWIFPMKYISSEKHWNSLSFLRFTLLQILSSMIHFFLVLLYIGKETFSLKLEAVINND